jgi:hypothetical protein
MGGIGTALQAEAEVSDRRVRLKKIKIYRGQVDPTHP